MQYAFEEDKLVEENNVNSIFTSAIVDGIKSWKADRDNNNQISITELYDYVDGYVNERTPHQRPSMWSLDTQGEMIIAEREYAPELDDESVEVYEVDAAQFSDEAQSMVGYEQPVVELDAVQEVQGSVELEQPVIVDEPVSLGQESVNESRQKFPIKSVIVVASLLVVVVGLYWSGLIPYNSTFDDGGAVQGEIEGTAPVEDESTPTSEFESTSSWEGTLMSGWSITTPIFDGIINDEEWEDAFQEDITLTYLSGQATSIKQYNKPARIYCKNDDENLYIALAIENVPYIDELFTSVDFLFDENNNGVIDDIEDFLWCYYHVYSSIIYPDVEDKAVKNNDTNFYYPQDIDEGGTVDVLCSLTHSNPILGETGTLYLEVTHRLDSNDDYDVSLTPGSILGFGILHYTEYGYLWYSWPNGVQEDSGWDRMITLVIASNP